MQFREVSEILSEIYYENCIAYNFGLLNDCLLVIEKFLVSGWPSGDSKIANAFLRYFQWEQVSILLEVLKLLFEECKKGKELYQINYGEVNVEIALVGVLEKFILAHQGFAEEKSLMIVDALGKALVFFKNSVRTSTSVSLNIDNESLLNAVQKFVRAK